MDARAAAGLPAYGEPTMDEAAQAAAARNSKYSALKFGMYSIAPLNVFFYRFLPHLFIYFLLLFFN
jgi:hypothetical protein